MNNSFLDTLDSFFFKQENSLERVALLRVLVVGIALIMLLIGPYDTVYHIKAAPLMFRPRFPLIFIESVGEWFFWLKSIALIAGVFSLLGLFNRVSLTFFTLFYCTLNFLIHCYQDHYCMNQAHINFILLFLCFARSDRLFCLDAVIFGSQKYTKRESEYASWVITASGAFIATLLFQTGVSKLIYGGVGWFLSGDTLYVETIIDGTQWGRLLTSYNWFFPFVGISVAVFELICPWMFLSKKLHFYLGLLLLFFHLSTFITMGITFWFLWPLYFPVFLGVPRIKMLTKVSFVPKEESFKIAAFK